MSYVPLPGFLNISFHPPGETAKQKQWESLPFCAAFLMKFQLTLKTVSHMRVIIPDANEMHWNRPSFAGSERRL